MKLIQDTASYFKGRGAGVPDGQLSNGFLGFS